MDLFDDNVELSKQLAQLMEDYTQAKIESLTLKTEFAQTFAESRKIFATHFGEEDLDIDMQDATAVSVVDKKKSTLHTEEQKLEQMKMLTQKLMMSFPNINRDSVDELTGQHFQKMFFRCGEPISKLREDQPK
jgi:seryl-tRNA synthetase